MTDLPALTEPERLWMMSAVSRVEAGLEVFWYDCDEVADQLAVRGFIKSVEMDWYGCWVELTQAGLDAMCAEECLR